MTTLRHFAALSAIAVFYAASMLYAETVNLHVRSRDPETGGAKTVVEEWNPQETAIIVCDMWDKHWCKAATSRVGEMAPAMNKVLKIAREKGVLIIHAPSETLEYYKDNPAFKRGLDIEPSPEIAKFGGKWCNDPLPLEKGKKQPIDDKDGGCDCEPKCRGGKAWSSQIAVLEIDPDKDLISDNGTVIGSYMKQRGIKNVILMGVHLNMCVRGRSFGMRRNVMFGNNTVLMRDMTDTMYNSRSFPHVSHFEGTELMIQYTEKYICPSITSTDFTGEPRFNFKGNEGNVVTGENKR
ncbi:MAG: isochorismatase family protein [Planctomycetaceae bacterium]|jgi:nicotinamidase-related amidase|nr:isochorismatase family protein [Planctomycetaceae bacterium]